MNFHPAFSMPGVALALSLALTSPACPVRRVFPPPPPTGTADDLFDSGTLHDLRLSIRTEDLNDLRSHFRENTFYPADLKWRDVTVHDVAIRSRGLDSRDWKKPGLLIDMNRDTPGQTFLGLESLVLDNLRQDPAMMREFLAMATFRRMGQPAPRVSYCRLYLNNEYQGLYAIVEDIDKAFMTRSFGRNDGFLFEYQWSQRFDGEYLGNDLSLYRALLEARTHTDDTDGTLYEPIRAMFEAVNAPEEAKERAEVEAFVDLPQFVRFLAIEKTITDLDAFAGYHGMNNFWLYRGAGSNRHSFLVWDRDRSFNPELLSASIFHDVELNAFARRALSYEDLYTLYVTVAGNTARALSDNRWLASEIDRIWKLVGDAAYEDAGKPYTNAELDDAVAWLRQLAIDRPAIVLNEIDALPDRSSIRATSREGGRAQ
jgi:CotH kinase protein